MRVEIKLQKENLDSYEAIMKLYQEINNHFVQKNKVELNFKNLTHNPTIAMTLLMNNLYDLYSVNYLNENIELKEANEEVETAYSKAISSLESHMHF